MNEQQYVIIDKIKWWIFTTTDGRRVTQPICPTHSIRLYPVKTYHIKYLSETKNLKCAECASAHLIPRQFQHEQQYVLDKVDSKIFKSMRFINIDDEAVPLSEDKKSSKNNKYFVTAILIESRIGKRVVVYAGEKGKKEKTQIFIEPEIKRLAFDQKDLHPTDVFVKLEATFADNTKSIMEKS